MENLFIRPSGNLSIDSSFLNFSLSILGLFLKKNMEKNTY